jgi:hypothetical protein
MGLVSSAQPFNWNWVDNNGNTNLVVGGAIWDVTNPASPVQVTIVQMVSVGNGAYSGSYQGVQGKNYVVQSSVYEDNTWAALNPAFPPGAESFQCAPVASQSTVGVKVLRGEVVQPPQLRGVVVNPPILRGVVYCQGG